MCRFRGRHSAFVASIALCEPPCADFVAGTASAELEDENWRLCSTTLVRGAICELEAENWRLCSATLVRGVSGELEDENWRLSSTTLVRGAICGAGS